MFDPFSTGLMILTLFATFIDTSAVGIGMGIADVCDGVRRTHIAALIFTLAQNCRFVNLKVFREISGNLRFRENCLEWRGFTFFREAYSGTSGISHWNAFASPRRTYRSRVLVAPLRYR